MPPGRKTVLVIDSQDEARERLALTEVLFLVCREKRQQRAHLTPCENFRNIGLRKSQAPQIEPREAWRSFSIAPVSTRKRF